MENPNVLTIIYTSLTRDIFEIESFLIYNDRSNAHFCNSKSTHLYTKLDDAGTNEYLNSSTEKMKIESWGHIETAFESPTGLTLVVIQNIAYVGKFITSLISQSILDTKGLHFDTGRPCLYQNNTTIYFLHCIKGHYTFTVSRPSYFYSNNANKIFAMPITAAPSVSIKIDLKECLAVEWHKIIAHASEKVITYLEDSSQSITVSKSSSAAVFKTHQCETYISKSFHNQETSQRTEIFLLHAYQWT